MSDAQTRPRGPRGRRPGAPDTRGEILSAARRTFAERGFTATTVRAVAAGAGVDPALVHHYFGTKDDLFVAAMELPVDPRPLLAEAFAPGLPGAGERLLTAMLTVWDAPEAQRALVALVRGGIGGGDDSLLREGFFRLVLTTVTGLLPADEAAMRAQLLASQVLGLIVVRYVLRFEPMASLTREQVVRLVAPSVQRALDGPLDLP